MKKILRLTAREIIALYLTSLVASGLLFNGKEVESLIIAGLALAGATMLVKPIINILILPITLATMGLFKFLAHTITLFIVDTALPQFEVTGFHFAGFTSPYFDLPPVNFEAGLFSYIAFSIVLYAIVSTIHWVAK
jgi:uncharacterized membrane protein YvlD (DUF360 family)